MFAKEEPATTCFRRHNSHSSSGSWRVYSFFAFFPGGAAEELQNLTIHFCCSWLAITVFLGMPPNLSITLDPRKLWCQSGRAFAFALGKACSLQEASDAALSIDTEDHKAWYRLCPQKNVPKTSPQPVWQESASREGPWQIQRGPGPRRPSRCGWGGFASRAQAEESLAKLEDVAQWCVGLSWRPPAAARCHCRCLTG